MKTLKITDSGPEYDERRYPESVSDAESDCDAQQQRGDEQNQAHQYLLISLNPPISQICLLK